MAGLGDHQVRRRHSIGGLLLVALSVGIILVCAASCCFAATTYYTRISVSPQTTIYVEFSNDEMRMADSVAGLKTATSIQAKSSQGEYVEFPEVALPLGAVNPRTGYTEVRTVLELEPAMIGILDQTVIVDRDAIEPAVTRTADRIIGTPPRQVLGYLCPRWADQRKREWSYWFRVSAPAGMSLETAPMLRVPEMRDPKVDVVTQVDKQNLYIGVRLTVDSVELSDLRITRGGAERRPSAVGVIVRDAAGHLIARSRGRLDKFGFG
jgi:hypothetical protein